MTATPAAERCPTCDRERCDGPFISLCSDSTCSDCAESRECRSHAVDWRARAIAAEAERSAILALVSPSSDQSLPDAVRELCEQVEELRADAAKWAKVAPLIERLRKKIDAADLSAAAVCNSSQVYAIDLASAILAATEPTP